MATKILPELNILFIGAQTEHIMSCVFGLGSFSLKEEQRSAKSGLPYVLHVLARGTTGEPKAKGRRT